MARITRAKSAIQLDKGDLETLSKELFKLIDDIPQLKVRRSIIEYAGQILKNEAQRLAPRSGATHFRYNTPKLVANIRAPKGSGAVAGSYLPGNLQNSITDISDRRKRYRTYRVIIGPFYRSFKNVLKKGVYGATERTADGYYAHMVYGSAKAFRAEVTGKALQSKREQILQSIRVRLLAYLRKQTSGNKYLKSKAAA